MSIESDVSMLDELIVTHEIVDENQNVAGYVVKNIGSRSIPYKAVYYERDGRKENSIVVRRVIEPGKEAHIMLDYDRMVG
jgi:hypothetical protein